MRNLSTHVRMIAVAGAVILTALAANVVASTPENVDRLRSTGSCVGCDLFGANLSGLQAANADLTGANLGEATFYGGSLRGANLTNAILDGTDLKMVDMSGAIGVVLSSAVTDERTICPDGSAGPCE